MPTKPFWDHEAKLKQLAVDAINRPRPYRPIKVVPHDPARLPQLTNTVSGWFGSEIFLLGKTPEQLERLLGFKPGYLAHGVAVFSFRQKIEADDIDIGGAYTHLPGGKPWDGFDKEWPPGLGAPQWRLKTQVPCVFEGLWARGVPLRL